MEHSWRSMLIAPSLWQPYRHELNKNQWFIRGTSLRILAGHMNSISWSCHFCQYAPPPQNPLILSMALRLTQDLFERMIRLGGAHLLRRGALKIRHNDNLPCIFFDCPYRVGIKFCDLPYQGDLKFCDVPPHHCSRPSEKYTVMKSTFKVHLH